MEKSPHKKTLAEHYDEAYLENPNMFGGGKPEQFVLDWIKMIPKDGSVIEFGAGQGRTAIALAERGLNVKAVDISRVGVESMRKIAGEKGLSRFQAEAGNCLDPISGEFDMVVSTFVLHHLTAEEAIRFIEEAKKHTKDGGINAIVTFTKDGDFAKSPNAPGRFYPASGELKNLYVGWEILSYKEELSEARAVNPDGSSMFNIKAEIVARKSLR